MKIAYIANYSSIHTRKWVDYFISEGHRCCVYDKNQQSIYGILADINEFNPDIVHAHYAGWNGFIGALTNRHPYIITVWGSDVIGNHGNILKREVVKYGLQKADLITTDAEHIMGHLARYGVQPQKIHRINFGVDTEMFKPNKIVHSGKIVVSLRSLEKIYDVQTLIRAVPYVVEEFNDVLFKIYSDGSQRQKLEQLVSKLDVSDYVDFCGKVGYNEIPRILNGADLYVSTALSDAGIASSTAEAMACGLPCIVTDNADNRQWLSAEQIFIHENSKDLAYAVIGSLYTRIYEINEDNRNKIVKDDNYLTEMGKMELLYEQMFKK